MPVGIMKFSGALSSDYGKQFAALVIGMPSHVDLLHPLQKADLRKAYLQARSKDKTAPVIR